MPRAKISEILSSISASEDKISGIITERTKLTTEEILALFAQGKTKDPAFALEKQIICEISNPAIPKDAIFFSFNITLKTTLIKHNLKTWKREFQDIFGRGKSSWDGARKKIEPHEAPADIVKNLKPVKSCDIQQLSGSNCSNP